jgi:SAM-dependent methyltransferase
MTACRATVILVAMDVVDLREFYASRLGNTTRRIIANRLRSKIGAMAGASVMGLGFAVPYLADGVLAKAGHLSAFMPARQGVIHWPTDGTVQSALVDELDLPLLESSVDLALVIHGLEAADAPEEMLKEIWRVLAPQGRLILVVPNRRGYWARFDSSPFGHGRPFSRPQLASLLRESEFSVLSWSQALYFPPVDRGSALAVASTLEAVGRRAMPALAGVIIVEAVKQVYAIAPGKRQRRLVPRLGPVLTPIPSSRGRLGPDRGRFAFDAPAPMKGPR